MSEYPEHEKLKLVSDRSQAIGEFLEWLLTDLTLCDWHENHPGYDGGVFVPARNNRNELLAEYFEIDQTALENEMRAMIAAMQQHNGESA